MLYLPRMIETNITIEDLVTSAMTDMFSVDQLCPSIEIAIAVVILTFLLILRLLKSRSK